MRVRGNKLLALIACLAVFSGEVAAKVEMQILAADGDVTLTASGTLDLATTANLATQGTSGRGAVDPGGAFAPSAIAGPPGPIEVRIECGGVVGPSTFGAGTVTWEGDEGTGDTFGIYGDGEAYGASGDGLCLIVPFDYQSGASLSGTAKFTNTSLSDMGLTKGTYEWSWGNGADSLVLHVGERPKATPVPVMPLWMLLPLTVALILLAFLASRAGWLFRVASSITRT